MAFQYSSFKKILECISIVVLMSLLVSFEAIAVKEGQENTKKRKKNVVYEEDSPESSPVSKRASGIPVVSGSNENEIQENIITKLSAPSISLQINYLEPKKLESILRDANNGNIEAQDDILHRFYLGLLPSNLIPKLKDFLSWNRIEERAYASDICAYFVIKGLSFERYGNKFPLFIEKVKEGAEANIQAAQNNLALMYRKGWGEVSQDDKEAVKWYKKAADQDFAIAQYNLAKMYLDDSDGGNSPEKVNKAIIYIKKAAKQGLSRAQNKLGWMYREGPEVNGFYPEKTDNEAVKWFLKAAIQGNSKAQYNLGLMYEEGRRANRYSSESDEEEESFSDDREKEPSLESDQVEREFKEEKIRNAKEAIEWYTLSAAHGNADAQYNLGLMYEKGKGMSGFSEDDKKAFALKYYMIAADQGHTGAKQKLDLMQQEVLKVDGNSHENNGEFLEWLYQTAAQYNGKAEYELGEMYKEVEEDDDEAEKWYTRAAKKGHIEAQYNLGWIYETDKRYKTALEWYTHAAEKAHIEAQNALGTMYQEGLGLGGSSAENDIIAVEWYTRAASQEDPVGQYNLGWMYENGRGVEKDHEEAVKWYHKAAKKNYALAQLELGRMYEEGRGVKKNEKKAAKWYHKAAKQNYLPAQLGLGRRYEEGRGVEKSEKEAVKWYKKAAQNNDAQHNEIEAQLKLWHMYAFGKGAQMDQKEAEKWYKQARMQVSAEGIIQWMIDDNEDKEKKHANFQKEEVKEKLSPGNKLEAYFLEKRKLKPQAKEGDKNSQYALGNIYYNLSLLYTQKPLKEVSFAKAIKWYKSAADENLEAQSTLKRLRHEGQVISVDEEGMKWYRGAISKAHVDFKEFIQRTNHSDYPLKLSHIIFMNLDNGDFAPTSIEWGGSLFPDSLNNIYEPLYTTATHLKYEDTIMGIDPSGDGKDETAYCVAKRRGDYYFILGLGGFAGGYEDGKHRMGNNPEVLQKLSDIAKLYKTNYVLIEKNIDNSFAELLRQDQHLGRDLGIIKWHNHIRKEKRIIETLKPLLENHKLVMNRQVLKEDFESQPQNDISYKFFYQFMNISEKTDSLPHDDRLDALAMAIKHLRFRREKSKDPEYEEEEIR